MKGNNKKLIDNMVDMSLHLLPTKELHGASITVQLFPSLTGLYSNKQENTIFVGGKATDSVTRFGEILIVFVNFLTVCFRILHQFEQFMLLGKFSLL